MCPFFIFCLFVWCHHFKISNQGSLYHPRITSDPTYFILSASGGYQVSSDDDNKTRKYKDKDTDKDKFKVLQRLNVCYIFERHGVQGFQILYWLSFGNDNGTHKDKEKVFEKPKVCYIFQKRGFQYFSGMTIFQGWIFFRDEYFSGVTIFHWSSVRFWFELFVHLAHFLWFLMTQLKIQIQWNNRNINVNMNIVTG